MKIIKIFVLTLISIVIAGTYARCQTTEKIENLKAFSRAYGYVKYFHPSVEADKIDWDKFAIYGSQKIIECTDKKQFISTLNNLFQPIAPTAKFFDAKRRVKFNIKTITPKDTSGYKALNAQYLGIVRGTGKYNRLYDSSVFNNGKKQINNDGGEGYGLFFTNITAKQYLGKRIKISGTVKVAEGSTGLGHLCLKIYTPNFIENITKSPIAKTSWDRYEVTGKVSPSASAIQVGCFLKGDGEMFVDDLHFYYEENGLWIEVPFEGSDFEVENYNEIINKNIWKGTGSGFLFSIDRLNCFQGKTCLSIKKSSKNDAIKKNFKSNKEPEIGDVIKEDIGSGVSCIIPMSLYCNNDGTYPPSDKAELDNAISEIDKNEHNLPLRLGNIIIAWNALKHFYPFIKASDVNWDNELEKALLKSFTDKDELDFSGTLRQLTAALKDDYLRVGFPKEKCYLPAISWEFIENKLVITKVSDKEIKLTPGDIVEKVNGVDPLDFFNEVKSRISAESDEWMTYRSNRESLMGDMDSTLKIVVNGQPIELIRNQTPNSLMLMKSASILDAYRIINDDIIYLNISKAGINVIKPISHQLARAKTIICDLRGYQKGNLKVLSYLLDNSEDKAWMHVPQVIYGKSEEIQGNKKYSWIIKPTMPRISAKIILITDGSAVSNVSSYIAYIKGHESTTVIGQPTIGAAENICSFTLPGNFYISWSDHHQDKIVPDIYINKTINGIREGRDEFLEKAIEVSQRLIKPSIGIGQ